MLNPEEIKALIDETRLSVETARDILERVTDALQSEHEARLKAEERTRGVIDALASAESWLDRWAKHVGNCLHNPCTCGLTAIRTEAEIALQAGGE